MIIKGTNDPQQYGRKVYLEQDMSAVVEHFVVRTVTPQNPFIPHRHEQEELWYMIEGQAVYQEDGQEHQVEAGDLLVIKPWVEHGLKTGSRAVWICLA